MPLKYGTKLTSKNVNEYAKANLGNYLTNAKFYLNNKTDVFRDEINRKTKTFITDYKAFWELFKKGPTNNRVDFAVKQMIDFVETTGDTSVMVSTETIREAFNKIVSSMGGQQSHRGFTIISAQLFIIYTHLGRLVASLKGIQKQTNGGDYYIRIAEKQEEWFRRMWITSKALADFDIGEFKGTDIELIDAALDQYYEGLTQQKLLLDKVTQIDVLAGKVNQTISIELKEDNEFRAEAEKLLGIGRKQALEDKVTPRFLREITQRHKDNFARFEGSKHLIQGSKEQIVDIFKRKKPKKYAHKGKVEQKAGKVKRDASIKLKQAKKAALAGGLKKIARSNKRTTEKGSSELLTLKRKINRRLSAQVRRNMGRPALINRTGRFSNSVELVNVREGQNTIIGEYTYMQNPYRTFENTGERKWPVGYNPKPLIAKSIRDLAIEYTDKKFTLRRV